MFHIAICDDDFAMAQGISDKVNSFLENMQIPHKIYLFENPSIFWSDIKECVNSYDVFILDLEMPDIPGQQLLKQIQDLRRDAYIILLTCHEQFVYDAYEWGVFRFISKANYEKRLFSALVQIYKNLEKEKNFYLYPSLDGDQKLYHSDILYITKLGKNAIFHTKSSGEIPIRISLAKLYHDLDQTVFCFVDRGCILNINHIIRVQRELGSVVLSGEINVAISRSKIKGLIAFISENRSGGYVKC